MTTNQPPLSPQPAARSDMKPGALDLTTPENRTIATDALPALVVGGMLGNEKASEIAIEIIGGIFAEALKPSIEAMTRINTIRRKAQS